MVSREMSTPEGHVDPRIEELERTLDSLRQDAEVAHVLLSLSAALAEIGPVEQTLEKAVRVASEILQADRAFAATFTPTQTTFDLRAHVGFDAPGLNELRNRAS